MNPRVVDLTRLLANRRGIEAALDLPIGKWPYPTFPWNCPTPEFPKRTAFDWVVLKFPWGEAPNTGDMIHDDEHGICLVLQRNLPSRCLCEKTQKHLFEGIGL